MHSGCLATVTHSLKIVCSELSSSTKFPTVNVVLVMLPTEMLNDHLFMFWNALSGPFAGLSLFDYCKFSTAFAVWPSLKTITSGRNKQDTMRLYIFNVACLVGVGVGHRLEARTNALFQSLLTKQLYSMYPIHFFGSSTWIKLHIVCQWQYLTRCNLGFMCSPLP